MPRVVFINGTVGVGKTSIAQAVGRRLEDRVPHAIIDTDALRNRWPTSPDDPFDLELELLNLTALSTNYRARGTEILIISGVIEDREVIPRYVDATGVEPSDFVLVRLKADLDAVAQRIKTRSHTDEEEREWHLRRAPELDGILDRAQLPGVTVDANASVDEVVASILGELGIQA